MSRRSWKRTRRKRSSKRHSRTKMRGSRRRRSRGSLGKLHCFWISSFQRSLCLSQQQPSPAQPSRSSLLINNAYTGRLKSEIAMYRDKDRDREREQQRDREGETKRGNVAHCLLIL